MDNRGALYTLLVFYCRECDREQLRVQCRSALWHCLACSDFDRVCFDCGGIFAVNTAYLTHGTPEVALCARCTAARIDATYRDNKS